MAASRWGTGQVSYISPYHVRKKLVPLEMKIMVGENWAIIITIPFHLIYPHLEAFKAAQEI